MQTTQQTKLRVERVMSSCAVLQSRHSQSAWTRHVERVKSRRDEPSGIWAIVYVCQNER